MPVKPAPTVGEGMAAVARMVTVSTRVSNEMAHLSINQPIRIRTGAVSVALSLAFTVASLKLGVG